MYPVTVQLRHLRAFAEIAEQRSFRRAAERLSLTQPAISRAIRELEGALGAPMFLRSRAGVALTPQGETFLPYAAMSLAMLTQGFDSLGGMAGGAARLTVGALPSVAARLMPTAVAHLVTSAPDLRLTITDGTHRHLLDQLRGGALDVLVGRLGSADLMQGLSFTQLYQEKVAFVVRPDHPLARGGGLAEVVAWPVLYPAEGSAIRPAVDGLFVAAGVAPPVNRIESVSHAFGVVFTRSSDAVWVISEGVVAAEIAEARLTPLQIDTTATRGPVGLITRADHEASPPRRLFERALRQAVAQLGLR